MARNTMNSIAQKAIPMHQVKRNSYSNPDAPSLHIVDDVATLHRLLEERDKEIASLKQQHSWLQGLLRNRNMSKGDCILASVLVEKYPEVLSGEEVKIDVRYIARKSGYSDSAVTKFLVAMKESEALKYTCEHIVDSKGVPTSASTIQANIAFMLAPNRINTKGTPTRAGETQKAINRQKIKLCPKCGSRHLKNKCDECGTSTEDMDMIEVTEDEAPRIQENIRVRHFITTFTSHENYKLYLDTNNQIVIGVPSDVNPLEFAMYEEFALEHEVTLRKMLEGKKKR